MRTAASKPRWGVVNTVCNLPVFEGSHAQCSNYIRQAIKIGRVPGFLRIVKMNDLERVGS